MSDIEYDRLTDLPLRDAWAHEALEFMSQCKAHTVNQVGPAVRETRSFPFPWQNEHFSDSASLHHGRALYALAADHSP